MAEGIVNHELRDSWEAYSAGLAPSDVHPIARKVMSEVGIDISRQFSKYLDRFENTSFDVIVTLCGNVATQCPNWVGKQKKVHIGFLDPASAADRRKRCCRYSGW
jgi:arsenate reductase